jgi:NAD(P)-dependent dehydrogenase (short-subunit alcohol dehydrogenase family)
MNWEPWRQEFLNKKVLLTGGSGQIGAVIGERYSLAGAFVANFDVEPPAGNPKPLEESSYSGQPGVYSLRVDITRRQSVEQAVDQMVRIAGGIDIVINCAGIGVFTPFEQRTDEEFDAVVDLNLKGTFLVTQAVSRAMIDQGTKGVILNVSSIYGISAADKRMYGNSGRNSSEVYAMTKAGIIHFTKYMAKYLASYNIRVNCVSPGGVFADQDPQFVKHYVDKTPLGRLADPEDLIGGIFFLTSSWSQYVTGQNLVIDGGFTIGD